MSFANYIKNMFGFGPDNGYGYDETDDDPDVTTYSTDTPAAEGSKATDADVEGMTRVPTLPEISPEMKARIFDGAVAIFNSALPDFMARSVDPRAQARLLADAIDRGVDDYLNGLMLQAEQYAEGKLRAATETAQRESEKLRADLRQIEQQRSSIREQQLSADRRRRALSERVTDLESQLAKVEAEREQFELENRSLMNKLKVADVQLGDVENMTHEIQELHARIAAGTPAPDTAAIEQLKAEMEAQQQVNEALYNDMQSQFVAERDARTKAEAEVEEARKLLSDFAQIQQQMTKVEELIHARDERITRLKASNKHLREQLEAAEQSIAELKNLSDNGLFNGASIKKDNETAADATTDEPAMSMATLEDEFEVPDWFVSEPAPGEVSPLLQPDPEFGYQEPAKKPRRPENDAQLSLF